MLPSEVIEVYCVANRPNHLKDNPLLYAFYTIFQGWGAGAGCFWLLGAGAGAA